MLAHQSIHFGEATPSTNVIPPPSLRKLIPPSTKQITAAAGASRSSTLMMSFKSRGVGIGSSNPRGLFRQAAGTPGCGVPTACRVSRIRLLVLLGNTSCAVGDPKLDQAGHAGDTQQRSCGEQPSSKTSAREPGYDGPYHSAPCSDRRDDVAYPVDEVQEGAFRLRPGFTLARPRSSAGRSPGSGPTHRARARFRAAPEPASSTALTSFAQKPPFCLAARPRIWPDVQPGSGCNRPESAFCQNSVCARKAKRREEWKKEIKGRNAVQ
jgi:hypothetical protein